jgi:hypothetical protein
MMKKILGIVGLAVIAVIIALNINASLKKGAAFDVALANVEVFWLSLRQPLLILR